MDIKISIVVFACWAPLALSQSACDANQWMQDACESRADGKCNADPAYSYYYSCTPSSDCIDCDPCAAKYAGYGGCGHCLGVDGCSWCQSSGTCVSTAAEGVVSCPSGWESATCDASNDHVAGQIFTDPAAPHQRWFLEAINVQDAWALGYTGQGVNIMFEDDALDINHPDIAPKFNLEGSGYWYSRAYSGYYSYLGHGTNVVGFAVAAANNSECGVGVAYGATVSFAKTEDPISFTVGVDNGINHIHSNSWGIDSCAKKETLTEMSYALDSPDCPFMASTAGTPCSATACNSTAGWQDVNGLTCQDYSELRYCTSDGSAGTGFPDGQTFEGYAVDGVSALQACCACGGGSDYPACPDWQADRLSYDCITAISTYCASNEDDGGGVYDPACEDHWDLWVDCEHQALSEQYRGWIQHGVTAGRGGKGMIYVFAVANAGDVGSNANFEGFLNSIYTISVAATALDGKHAWYAANGAVVHVCAPGGEGPLNGKMPTVQPTWGPNPSTGCGDAHFGTSFATPLVSAVVALMLEANPELGWRDVQDILARTATYIDPDHASWVMNGAGLRHSDTYGFGQVNAGAAVIMARDWTMADSTPHALLAKEVSVNMAIPADATGVQCGVSVSVAEASHVASVEHVVVYITTSGHPHRGELRVKLTSPAGTKSQLAWPTSELEQDYEDFKFMTLKNWGETPSGVWTLSVIDERQGEYPDVGALAKWTLVIYGKCANSDGTSCRTVLRPSGQVYDWNSYADTIVSDGQAVCSSAPTSTSSSASSSSTSEAFSTSSMTAPNPTNVTHGSTTTTSTTSSDHSEVNRALPNGAFCAVPLWLMLCLRLLRLGS